MECLAPCYRTFVSPIVDCLTQCFRGLYWRKVEAIASLTPCLTELSSYMEEKYGYTPRRGSEAADQIAASLHLGIPKQLPQDQISSKLELEYDIWVRSGVLEYLDSRSENTQRPRARAQPSARAQPDLSSHLSTPANQLRPS